MAEPDSCPVDDWELWSHELKTKWTATPEGRAEFEREFRSFMESVTDLGSCYAAMASEVCNSHFDTDDEALAFLVRFYETALGVPWTFPAKTSS